MSSIPKVITRYCIHDSILYDTLYHLREVGDEHREGIAYWSGILDKDKARITRAIFADSFSEFQNEQCFAHVSLDTVFRIGEEIHEKHEILFAQIHTHPGKAFHSLVDDIHPISHRLGFVSIVIPNFARNITSLSECAIFEYLGKANWNELSDNQVADKFIVESTAR